MRLITKPTCPSLEQNIVRNCVKYFRHIYCINDGLCSVQWVFLIWKLCWSEASICCLVKYGIACHSEMGLAHHQPIFLVKVVYSACFPVFYSILSYAGELQLQHCFEQKYPTFTKMFYQDRQDSIWSQCFLTF